MKHQATQRNRKRQTENKTDRDRQRQTEIDIRRHIEHKKRTERRGKREPSGDR